jgi:hypothetical protein
MAKLEAARARIVFPDAEPEIVKPEGIKAHAKPVVTETWEPPCVTCGEPIGYTARRGCYHARTECTLCVYGSVTQRLTASGIGEREIQEPLFPEQGGDNDFARYVAFLHRFAALTPGSRLDPPFAYVCGQNGVGKSAGAQRALRDAIKNGCQGRFLRLSQLLDAIYATYGSGAEESTEERMRFYSTVHLLVVDECGGENATEHAERRFFDLVDERWKNRLPTIFTSNYLPQEDSLGAHITGGSGDPTRMKSLLDRIRGGAGNQIYVIRGKSRRIA